MSDQKIRMPFAAGLSAVHLFILLYNTILELNRAVLVSARLVIFLILDVAVAAFLAFALFGKKRNNLLLLAVGCHVVFAVIYFSFIDLLAYALLLVFVAAMSEQTVLKTDLSGIRAIAIKFFWLPALIMILGGVYSFVRVLLRGAPFSFISLLLHLFPGLIALSLVMWLKDPYAKVKPITASESQESCGMDAEAYCGLGKHIVLCLFTFGIWYLIWIYRTTKFLNQAPQADYYNPTAKLLLCIFIPFYQIYWFYKHGQRIDSFSKQRNLHNSDMAVVCLVLGIFIPILACILMQDKINAICTAKASE